MVQVTVGQWDASSPQALLSSVDHLKNYLDSNPTDILLLPELPFSDWFTSLETYNDEIWHVAEEAHLHWIDRLSTFDVPTIIGTRPKTHADGSRTNTSWIWHNGSLQDLHDKYYLPNEEGFWEANWYTRGNGDLAIANIGEFKLGILICTELWFMDQARDYANEGIHILLVPRSTPIETVDKWLHGGQTAAVISGSFCLSSNHSGVATDGDTTLGGKGWITNPEGQVLKSSDEDHPWVTLSIDEVEAEEAKMTYPRYVKD